MVDVSSSDTSLEGTKMDHPYDTDPRYSLHDYGCRGISNEPHPFIGPKMSALESLIQLVEDGKLDGISIDTSGPGKNDSLLLVFPGGIRLEVRAEYQYDEGGRSYLAINDESLPAGMELAIGKGV